MFRPIRTLILMVLLFIAGALAERYQHSQRCEAAGGNVENGLCKGVQRV